MFTALCSAFYVLRLTFYANSLLLTVNCGLSPLSFPRQKHSVVMNFVPGTAIRIEEAKANTFQRLKCRAAK